MTKAVTVGIEKIENHQRAFFYGLIGLALILATAYGYFLNAAIRNVVARQAAETRIADMHSTIGTLEERYVSLKSSVTPERATEKGFVAVTDPHFIARSTPVPSFSLNTR